MSFNVVNMFLTGFSGWIFFGRMLSQLDDNRHFEKECIDEQKGNVFYFNFLLDPLFYLSLLFPMEIYKYWGLNALLLVWIIFSFGQLIVWIVSTVRYNNRPQSLKRSKWYYYYLCWIIGYSLSLVIAVILVVYRLIC